MSVLLITWSLPPKGKSSGTSAASWWQAGPAGGQFREATEVESHTLSLVSHTEWYLIQWYRMQYSGIVYYGCNSDYCGLNRALLYPVQSGPMCRYDPPQWQNRADTTVWEHRQAQLGLAHRVAHHRHTVVLLQA